MIIQKSHDLNLALTCGTIVTMEINHLLIIEILERKTKQMEPIIEKPIYWEKSINFLPCGVSM
jgi:hypothetical protein